MKGRNRTIFLLLTSQLAITCLFVCFGLAYYNISVILKEIDNKLIILMLLEICCGFGFLLFVRLVFVAGNWILVLRRTSPFKFNLSSAEFCTTKKSMEFKLPGGRQWSSSWLWTSTIQSPLPVFYLPSKDQFYEKIVSFFVSFIE